MTRQLAIIKTYDELISAFRARADELQITRETIDAVSGLQCGYSGKLLGNAPIRQLGKVSLGPMLQTLGLALVVVEDLAALQRIEKQPAQRARKKQDTSHTILPRKKRKKWRFPKGREFSDLMNSRRTLRLDPAKRRRIARKAIRARWRKHREARRAVRSAELVPASP